MITLILVLSAIFIIVAFTVTEENAEYLLAGYNTMSAAERENFDIKGYIPYFRNFHIFLGVSLLIIGFLLLYFVSSDYAGIFAGTYPILAYVYFIWKAQRFTKVKTKKQNIITYVAMSAMLLLFLVIVYEFQNGLDDNEFRVANGKIEIGGEYGGELKLSDLQSVSLVNELPDISSKASGFALETIQKGYFNTTHNERVKLLINSTQSPIILLVTKDNQKIYYSSKDKSNERIYKELKSEMPGAN